MTNWNMAINGNGPKPDPTWLGSLIPLHFAGLKIHFILLLLLRSLDLMLHWWPNRMIIHDPGVHGVRGNG